MPTPIIIPMSQPPKPTCPECGKPECVREVCDHCGYEYPFAAQPSWKTTLVFFGIVAGFFWFVTFLFWLLERASYRNRGITYIDFMAKVFRTIWDMLGDLW